MPVTARWLNTVVGAMLLVITIYRAATQAFTVDEAATYIHYVQFGWNGIFHGPFDANNHILYSVLEKLTRQWFGMSELSLRLPSVVGAALFFWSLARLCALLVPGVWFSLLSFVVVAGNPLMLDFMVAARGYGLALSLLTFALLQLVLWMDDGQPKRVLLGSVLLGLSAAANLIFAFSTLGACGVALLFLLWRRQFRLVPVALFPALLIPLAFWYAPFQNYDPAYFYFGTPTIYSAVESFENSLFIHDITRGDPFGNWFMLYYLRMYVLPVVALALLAGALFWLRKPARLGLSLIIFVFAVTCFGTWLAHAWLGILYPQERTGLALIFLFLLSWTAAIGVLWHAHKLTRWMLAFPNLLLALVFVAQFVGQFDARYFGPWRINWTINEVMSQLRRNHGTIRTDWIYQSSAEYYRLRWKMQYPSIVREGDHFDLNNADFFILNRLTAEEAAATGLRVLYRDEASGTTLLQK